MAPARRWTTTGASLALVLAVATALSVSIGVPGSRAQGASDPPHPVHIHSGTCDNLGDVVEPLTDVALNTAGEVFGLDTAIPVEESETDDVPLSMSTLLSSPHAINVHESAEAIQNYIACGDIGGRVVDGDLLIGLGEINGSGHSGIARIESDDDDDDDDVEVYVYLSSSAAPASGETAPATDDAAATAPASDDAAATDDAAAGDDAAQAADDAAQAADDAALAEDVPVDIRDFAFSPDPVEVAVGSTITWTNQDGVPHTATAEERDVLQSGAIAAGSSFSQVFETPGEFPYFCEFHPNMQGTIVVQ